jgi:threonine dehydratase
MKVKATIVMPITTPNIKTDAVKNFGGEWAEIILYGDSFEQAKNYAVKLSETQSLTYVPPFDHLDIIAGQGTIGKEIYEQWRQVDYVFVAVGGGGLISGISAYLGDIAPHIKVIAIEPEEAACLKVALDTGERKILPQVGLFCDGVAVAQIGKLPFEIVQLPKSDSSGTLIESEIVTCSNDEVCAAVKDIFEENRSIVEPSGALPVAGMKKYIAHHKLQGKNCLAIICGANMNFDRLRYIAERIEMGENKEAIFAVSIPERIGAFLEFCRTLQGRNITEFNYRRSVSKSEPAAIFVGISLKYGQTERSFITKHLKERNYEVQDLTND